MSLSGEYPGAQRFQEAATRWANCFAIGVVSVVGTVKGASWCFLVHLKWLRLLWSCQAVMKSAKTPWMQWQLFLFSILSLPFQFQLLETTDPTKSSASWCFLYTSSSHFLIIAIAVTCCPAGAQLPTIFPSSNLMLKSTAASSKFENNTPHPSI